MLYWISFASADRFLGMVIVDAPTLEFALPEAKRRGLYPGGQAMIVQVPNVAEHNKAWPHRNRLMQADEVERIFGPKEQDLPALMERAGPARAKTVDPPN